MGIHSRNLGISLGFSHFHGEILLLLYLFKE